MALSDVVKYDNENVQVNTYDFGESTTYTDSDHAGTTLAFSALWSIYRENVSGGGTQSDKIIVFVPVDDMTFGPIRKGVFVRAPLGENTSYEVKKWETVDNMYRVEVQKKTRPTP